jgi:hypothetical protein
VGDTSGKAAATAKNTIPLSGFAPAAAAVDLGSQKLTNVATPSGSLDAANKQYVDDKVGSITTGPNPPTSPTTGTTYYNTTDKTFYVYDGTGWVPVNNLLPSGQLYVGDASGKAAATAKNTIPLSGFAPAAAAVDLGSQKLTNVATPADNQDAATKKYVDDKVGSITTGPNPPTSPSTGTTYYNTTDKTFYVYDGTGWVPVNNLLPTGQLYVGDTSGKAAATAKNTIPLSGFAPAAASVDLGSQKLINVATPADNQDAATKKYVDDKSGTIPTTQPTSPQPGTTYFDITAKTFYVYDGSKWVPVDNALPQDEFYVGDANGKAVHTPKSSITLSGFGYATADVSMGNGSNNYRILYLATPSGPMDAANKQYVDDKTTTPTAKPADPKTGDTYYNTTEKTFYIYDGSKWIPAGDNLGNHTASQNLLMSTYAINNDGQDGKGLTFETAGNAIFAQDVTVKGNFYTPSDERLKTKIETLSKALQSIDRLRGVRFEYKDQKRYAKGPKIGVIAQELQKVFPEMVTKGADGYFKVDYTQLTAVLIEAVKEQQLQINELNSRLNKQQEQINAILKKMDK